MSFSDSTLSCFISLNSESSSVNVNVFVGADESVLGLDDARTHSSVQLWQRFPRRPANLSVSSLTWRKQTWKPVSACEALTAGQTCSLTRAFKDPFDDYVARVQAFTASRRSRWTVAEHFQPASDSEAL